MTSLHDTLIKEFAPEDWKKVGVSVNQAASAIVDGGAAYDAVMAKADAYDKKMGVHTVVAEALRSTMANAKRDFDRAKDTMQVTTQVTGALTVATSGLTPAAWKANYQYHLLATTLRVTADAEKRVTDAFTVFDKVMQRRENLRKFTDDVANLGKKQKATAEEIDQAQKDAATYAQSLDKPAAQAKAASDAYQILFKRLRSEGFSEKDATKALAPLRRLAGDVGKEAAKIPAAIKAQDKNNYDAAFGSGRNLMIGISAGIQGAKEQAIQAATGAMGYVVGGLRRAAKIESPSKVTTVIGEQLVAGLRIGIAHSTGSAKEAAQKLMEDVLTGMKDARSTARDAIQSTAATMMGFGGVRYDSSAFTSASDAMASARAAMTAAQGDNSAAGLAAYTAALTDFNKARADQAAAAPTAKNIFASQSARLAKMTRFAAAIGRLKSLKLNKVTFAQILEAGPDGGGLELAEALGNAAAVATENRLTGQMQSIANTIGFTGYAVASGGVVTTSGNNQTLSVVLNIDGKAIQTSLVTLRRRQGSLAFL